VQLLGTDSRTWFSTSNFDAASTEPDEIHRCGPLPSTFSVRALGAIQALLSGNAATRSLRALAVGASERWAPDEATFAAGFGCFAERHGLEPLSTPIVRRSLVVVARKLILASKADVASKGEAALDNDETNADLGETRGWDAERVVRHLERGVAHAYQLLQRARWLCLLHESAVVFREPPCEKTRLLVVCGGRIVEARDLLPGEPVPSGGSCSPLRERKGGFDRGRYDRLRTLTTELKRVLRDDGTAAIRVGRDRWLRGGKLDALLLWV
jgi:hypothetical protein